MTTPEIAETKQIGKLIPCVISVMVAVFLAATTLSSNADVPDSKRTRFSGMFKVTTSSDSLFPMVNNNEWFLDFGDGVHDGIQSGKVAVSLRKNPNVSVRIMVWQYFPDTSTMVIGNQFEGGSAGAVVKAAWTIGSGSGGVVFVRDGAGMVLNRAAPGDY